ncbi:MAG: class I SAM-dependent methyltransferase [Candidatus Marsarchaeota archaeon]|nr:class I SAM-dependent methyltransferase [Candidatus Marsarchaeota archaeon]MCL5106330.1 class I SAM-dependent methyltransferase [Candidatus Marsarchaeota archaeon]
MNIVKFDSRYLGKFNVNSGLKVSFSSYKYSERMIEVPFLFMNILPAPAKVLDIGCCEGIYPIQLAMMGYNVTGIDTRQYGFQHENFRFIKTDFLKLNEFKKESFDVILNISSVEHFGLKAYGNRNRDPDADSAAMQKIKELLKPGGQLIFTAPFGKKGRLLEFERIYDTHEINYLLRGFKIIKEAYYKVYQNKQIHEISREQAEKIEHAVNSPVSGTVCISAKKI